MIFVNSDRKTILITLEEKEVEDCKKLALKKSKYDKWGKRAKPENKKHREGHGNSPEDKYLIERIGAYGEKSFSLLTGLPVNETISMRGDKWDFVFPFKNKEITIDMKNSETLYEKYTKNKYGCFFIRAINDYGKPKKLESDYYCFSVLVFHNGTTRNKRNFLTELNATRIIVEIYGFISRESILANKEERISSPIAKKRSPQDRNYFIKKEELIDPVSFLWDHRHSLNNGEMDIFI